MGGGDSNRSGNRAQSDVTGAGFCDCHAVVGLAGLFSTIR